MTRQSHLELKKEKKKKKLSQLFVFIHISTYFAMMVRIKINTESADYLQELGE